MASETNNRTRPALKLGALLFPPLMLLLIWGRKRSLLRKILGTVVVFFYTVLYCALIIFLLIRFTGLEIEWRGGYGPALTYHKTQPDYAALERHRTQGISSGGGTNAALGMGACWPGFWGPTRDGHFDGPILTNWPAAGLRPVWRQPIGGGYASFAISEGLAFTIEQRREQEVATAYRLVDGQEVWTNSWPGKFEDYFAEAGPRATPAYSEGRIFVLGALGQLRCLEATSGRVIWKDNILTRFGAKVPTYGVAASPLMVENRLIVLSSAGNGHSLVCLNKDDGKVLWTSLDDVVGYSSPVVATLAGERQLLVCGETRTKGLRVEDGKELWAYPWQVQHDNLPIAQPVLLGSNQFMLSAGYFTGCAAVEVKKTDSGFAAQTVWRNKNLKNKFTSSVFWQGHIYGLDEDILTCLDATTGERKWKEGRYGYGQLLLANGFLIVLGGDGELALVKGSPERHEELARFQAIRGKTWNHMAVCGNRLLVRNGAEMACFEISSSR